MVMDNDATCASLTSFEKSVYCSGCWTIKHLNLLLKILRNPTWPESDDVIIDGSSIKRLDSAGALAMSFVIKDLIKKGKRIKLKGFRAEQKALLSLISSKSQDVKEDTTKPIFGFFYGIGRMAYTKFNLALQFLDFIGQITYATINVIKNPKRFIWSDFYRVIYDTGYTAVPIIALLSFLVGVVLAYLIGNQLTQYGADIFVVKLTGMANLREFGPLITAIVCAGRTSSSITALIGLMKVNEEIDALKTMGISPIERLVLVRIAAVLITVPLLTFCADVFGILGSMVMAQQNLGISFYDFLTRLRQDVDSQNYLIGLYKTPVFAIVIATVGCFQGFMVTSSAESVGKRTTLSVVQAIFLIIIVNAIFAVMFSWQGL